VSFRIASSVTTPAIAIGCTISPSIQSAARRPSMYPHIRGAIMPRVVFTHAVSDPALWASKHAERVAAFAPWGANVTEYLSAGGGKAVAVSVDVHDMAAMQAALVSPEIAAAKQAHGVIDPVTVLVEHG
jgi:hypothetical protein